MQKDIIYIDVDDDITAIIGKVKAAKQKIVALVPPKRIGVLQSAVNLRLLARSAEQSGKRLVLISNNPALMALAASAKLPIAKNLQSKPEIAPIAALDIDDGEEVIDGASLSIGELQKTADRIPISGMISTVTPSDVPESTAPKGTVSVTPTSSRAVVAKPSVKVPNFTTFRKKLFLGIAGGVGVVAFLVWAIVFAPQATVTISAKTANVEANNKVTLSDTATTDFAAGTIKATLAQTKKDVSVSFTATGSKTVGTKAKGQVVFKNCESSTSVTVPAGTVIVANGVSYVTQTAATVAGGVPGFGSCTPGESDPVAIAAGDIGSNYNANKGTVFSVTGHSNVSATLYFRAVAFSDITGGESHQATVVSADDVQKATDQLNAQTSDDIKKQLASQLGTNVTVLTETFKTTQANLVSVPAVDTEAADGKAKLTASVTYMMYGVAKSEATRYLDAYFAKQISGKSDRRVYSNGADDVSFTNLTAGQSGYSATLLATGKVGPQIKDSAIKAMAAGKRYGEIQSAVQAIEGVDTVDIQYAPFWVRTAPSDTKRITVTFSLKESK